MIGAHPGLVAKVDVRSGLGGELPDAWILCFEPVFHLLRVLLVGPPQRTLGAQTQLLEQPVDRGAAELHPELPGHHLPHHLAGPQRELELHLHGVLHGDGLIQPVHGLAVELALLAAALPGFQRAGATGAVEREPVIDGGAVDAQGRSDYLGTFALLHAGNATLA